MKTTTRRQILESSAAVFALPMSLTLAPSIAFAAPISSAELQPFRYSKDISNYVNDDVSSKLGHFLAGKLPTSHDLRNVAKKLNLHARHIDSLNIDKKLSPFYAQLGSTSARLDNSNLVNNVIQKLQLQNPNLNPNILSGMLYPSTADVFSTRKFLLENGVSGIFRMGADVLTSLAENIKNPVSSNGVHLSPATYSQTAVHVPIIQNNYRLHNVQYSDYGVSGDFHARYLTICKSKSWAERHPKLCAFAWGAAGWGINELKDYLKNPENEAVLDEFAEFLACAPEAVLIMGSLLILASVALAAAC